MPRSGDRTFVGFGFGAIQAGLFLYEAHRSGDFRRLVVAEVVPDVVDAVRRSGGRYSVNIAYPTRVEREEIGPIEIAHPSNPIDRALLIEALAEAEEIATALPNVRQYSSDSPGSVHRILAEALRKKAASGGPRAIAYTAENHNHAAEILEAAVLNEIPEAERDQVRSNVRFLNTVIGKMSGVIDGAEEIEERCLAPVAPGIPRAFLVESFNRILISRISFEPARDKPPFRRGITVFEEKPDLLPFEEAKLYGHNSTHALAAYLGAMRGAARIADLKTAPGVCSFLEAAFLQESGKALIRRHQDVDTLFTPDGYRDYAVDLLARMFNPYLGDSVHRVGRDPARKLEWQDRLVGTIRVGLQHGVLARRYAFGAAAALASLNASVLSSDASLEAVLVPLWRRASPDPAESKTVLHLIETGRRQLKTWRDQGFPHLEQFIEQACECA